MEREQLERAVHEAEQEVERSASSLTSIANISYLYVVLGFVGLFSGRIIAFLFSDSTRALTIGIVAVVTCGASGQFLRGAGELRGSARLKAAGYFVGGMAYIVTASVALFNTAGLVQK